MLTSSALVRKRKYHLFSIMGFCLPPALGTHQWCLVQVPEPQSFTCDSGTGVLKGQVSIQQMASSGPVGVLGGYTASGAPRGRCVMTTVAVLETPGLHLNGGPPGPACPF